MARDPRSLIAHLLLACLVVAGAATRGFMRRDARGDEVDPRQVIAVARRAGLRVFEGQHLVLLSDRPASPDDELQQLPAVFDAAFETWCDHYGMAPADHAEWRAVGSLVVDPERFRSCGLLPPGIPAFDNGFCAGMQFWLMEQSNPAYRRHLLLHEGVHAFTLTLRGLNAPVWYAEGIAELLATHRLVDGAFVSTPIPRDAADVEQLGRIEAVRELREQRLAPSLNEVFATAGNEHGRIRDYAASWAASAFLAEHPRHRQAFTIAEAGPLDRSFTQRLQDAPGFDADLAARDFDAFTDDLDYGYDLQQMAVDWSLGSPLAAVVEMRVDPTLGWQNSGASVKRGSTVHFQTRGRSEMGRLPEGTIELTSEAQGITIDWYRGRPIGRLFLAQWLDDPGDGGRPRFQRLAEGSHGSFVAAADGPIFARINDSPLGRRDNGQGLELLLSP